LGASLEAIGLKTTYLDLETPEDYYRDITELGTLFGEEQRAADIVAYYRNLVEDTIRRTSDRSPPRTLVLQAAPGGASWECPPKEWMQTRMVRMAGGDPIWADAVPGNGWSRISPEQIAAWNPDAVFVVSYREDSSTAANAFRSQPAFAALKAVRDGRVFAMPQDFYSWDQPDARWIMGLRRIGALLHPSRFEDADPESELKKFYRFMYGIDQAAFDEAIRPRLKGEHGVR
jgi:iron complex transport system substrate-binding protein